GLHMSALPANLTEALHRLLFHHVLLPRHGLQWDHRTVYLRQRRERSYSVDIGHVDVLVDRDVLHERRLLHERPRRPGRRTAEARRVERAQLGFPAPVVAILPAVVAPERIKREAVAVQIHPRYEAAAAIGG